MASWLYILFPEKFFPGANLTLDRNKEGLSLFIDEAKSFKVLLENFLPQTVGKMYAGMKAMKWVPTDACMDPGDLHLMPPQERCDSRRIDWWTVVDFHHCRSQRIGCHLLSNGPYPFSSSLRRYNLAFEESMRFGGRHYCTLGEPLAKRDFFLITIYVYVRSRLTILIANLLKTISSSMGDSRDWSSELTSFWFARLRPGRALIDLTNITSTVDILIYILGTRVSFERCRPWSRGRLLKWSQ